MGEVVQIKRSKLVDKLYRESLGVNLSPEQVKRIRMFATWVFDCTDAHVAIVKEKDDFKVIAIPYNYNIITEKITFVNTVKYLFKRIFGKIKMLGTKVKTSEVEYYIKARVINNEADFEFVRKMPELPTYKLEEILRDQETNPTS